jgi:5'-nucleotidase
MDPRGQPYYWIGGDAPTGVPEHGTDFGALAEGFVSITPLQLDLTAYHILADLNSWLRPDQANKEAMTLPALLLPTA